MMTFLLSRTPTTTWLLCLVLGVPTFLASVVDAFAAVNTQSMAKSADLFSAHIQHQNAARNNAPNLKNDVVLTYLEINGWLLSMGGITQLIDPILEGPLDFGIPNLYQGNKKVLPARGLADLLPPFDAIVLTQGLGDHCHVETLRKLQKVVDPTTPIVAPPSARGGLQAAGWGDSRFVRTLKHGQTADITQVRGRTSKNSSSLTSTIRIRATEGALVGPPWQTRENGYLLTTVSHSNDSNDKDNSFKPLSVYIEPHVEFNARELATLAPVDVVISPVSGQGFPAFELVHGPKDTMRLLETLQPRFLVPMQNGDIIAQGPVASLVSEVGSVPEFQRLLATATQRSTLRTEWVSVTPGKDVTLAL